MSTRIQRALDGELGREELTREELQSVTQTEALISDVLASVPVRPIPDLSPVVLSQIAPEQSSSRNFVISLFRWFFQSSLQMRPAYAFAALLAVALGVRLATSPSPSPSPSPSIFVQFRLDAPAAKAVSLAGDFTNWQPGYQLNRSEPGVWTVVVPLQPGVHDYAFIVDGERWTPDPMAPAIADGFGGLNSRLAVLAPENRSL